MIAAEQTAVTRRGFLKVGALAAAAPLLADVPFAAAQSPARNVTKSSRVMSRTPAVALAGISFGATSRKDRFTRAISPRPVCRAITPSKWSASACCGCTARICR